LIIGCDNLESGRKCLDFSGTARPTDDHYDLLHAARHLRKKLPFQPEYKHVEGHQRTKHPRRTLTLWAMLNEDMDALAKAYWRHTAARPRPENCMPGEWTASYNGARIVTAFTSRLTSQLATTAIEDKWLKPRGTKRKPRPALLTASQLASLDHHISQRAWQSVSGNRKRFVTKLRCRLLPTGQRMQQYVFWQSSQCPLCLACDETTDHLFCCPDPRSVSCRETALTQFELELKDLHTAANIRRSLIALLRHALQAQALDLELVDRPDLRRLMCRQLGLDTLALVKGQLCAGWSDAQQLAFRNYAPWRSGEQWASQVITKLWTLSFTLWESRNAILHEKQENHPDIDPDAMDLSLLEEWTIGPEPGWNHGSLTLFRGTTCEALLAKPLFLRRQWLHYVRLARHIPLATAPPADSPIEIP
jgi:hypothetical protein